MLFIKTNSYRARVDKTVNKVTNILRCVLFFNIPPFGYYLLFAPPVKSSVHYKCSYLPKEMGKLLTRQPFGAIQSDRTKRQTGF